MKVSFVVINYKTGEELEHCIRSVHENSSQPYEVIVINNSPTEDLNHLAVEYPNVKIVTNSRNMGFARAANLGASLASGEYIFFLNPDTYFDSDVVGRLVKFLETHPDAGIVAPGMKFPSGRPQPTVRRFPKYYYLLFGRGSLFTRIFPNNPITRTFLYQDIRIESPVAVDSVSGAAMLIKRDIFWKLNGFDENYFLMVEDMDLAYRLKQMGYKVYYLPDVTVYHYLGRSRERAGPRIVREHIKGMLYFFSKHYKPPKYKYIFLYVMAMFAIPFFLFSRK